MFSLSCDDVNDLEVSSDTILETRMYDKEYIKDATLNEQINYRIFHLSQLVNELNATAMDFDQMFSGNNGKDKRFNKLFFSDLLYSNALDNKGKDVNEDTEFSLNAFTGLSEQDLLPYIEKIKNGDTSDPLFLVSSYDIENDKENVIGLKLDSEGKLKMVSSHVEEEDVFGDLKGKVTDRNAVYKVDSDGCGNYHKNASCGSSGSIGDVTTSGSVAIRKIQIRDKKDSWLSNAQIRFQKVTAGDFNPSNYYTHCGINNAWCNLDGEWLAQYSSREVKKGRVVNVNKHLGRKSGDFVLYALYEYDNWPAPKKTFERNINGADVYVEYRSYQTPYDHNVFTTYSGNRYGVRSRTSYTLDNRSIKYNFN
ncbi:hypothetical protein [Ulvibacterium sp.]|uniref:hypothetical protein n=1 Tax=Ulvibacterium sp. TaxID=2665914 RepID=UPI002631CF45|nr:hypothetical protein [Ulvibacterium sp.]